MEELQKLKKEYKKLKLSEIKEYEYNNKNHGENVKEIIKSIQESGYVAPIIVDENMVILAGHGRKLALKTLGVEEAEVLIVSGMHEDIKRKYRIKDNKLGELSERNLENLHYELNDLGDPDLSELFVEKLEEVNNTNQKITNQEIDVDNLETKGKSKTVDCPSCGHKFTA